MKKTIIGAIVGGIIIFIWQFLSWTVLNTHEAAQQYTPNQEAIMAALEANLPDDGGYYIPGLAPGASEEEMKKIAIFVTWCQILLTIADGKRKRRSGRWGARRAQPEWLAEVLPSRSAHERPVGQGRAAGAESAGALRPRTELPDADQRHDGLHEQRARPRPRFALLAGLSDRGGDARGAGDRDRRGARQGLQRHRPGRLHHHVRTPCLPTTADDRRAVDVHDALQFRGVADGVPQRVRQRRVFGDSSDASVAVLPIPDRAGTEGRAAKRVRDGDEAVTVPAGCSARRRNPDRRGRHG